MRVFISREMSADSAFCNLLESRGFQVTGLPLVSLSPLPVLDIPSSDWIFFSSKNAVKFFFQNEKALHASLQVRWAAIGPGTAKELSKHCSQVDFTGTGDPAETASLFEPFGARKTVLFPSARRSRQGVQRYLSPAIRCIKLEVYDNLPLLYPALREEEVLVFTSPLSAEAYFSSHKLQEKQQVVAIGNSTYKALQSLGIDQLTMANQTSEAAMAEAVLMCLGV